jgi:NAD-dependent deacetylase
VTQTLNLKQLHHSAESEVLAQALKTAQSVVVITGAGVSAESGISTFRGADGYWEKFRAEDLASPAGFTRDPELVWRWYNQRREAILAHKPNPGHQALVELEKCFSQFLLVTQNVDGYHAQAGSRQIVEIHGNIWELRCTRENKVWTDHQIFKELPVYCDCGVLARPNVLWFGEMYDPNRFQRAQAAAAQADLILVAGTSGRVWIVSGLLQAQKMGQVIEINLESTDLSDQADWLIQGPSGKVLPQLLELL